jgi:hypothetical protein
MASSNGVCFSNVLFRSIPEEGIADPVDKLAAMVQHQASPNRSPWAAAFDRIDGGLISIVATNHDIRTPKEIGVRPGESLLVDEADVKAAKAFHRIEHTFETLAFGMDLSEDARTMGLRIRLGCDNRQDTSNLRADVQTLIEIYRKKVEDNDFDTEYPDAAARAVLNQFVDRAVVDLVETSDGTSDVYIRSALDLPASSASLFAQMIAQDFAE